MQSSSPPFQEWRGHYAKCSSPTAVFIDRLERNALATFYKQEEMDYGTADQLTMALALVRSLHTPTRKAVQDDSRAETAVHTLAKKARPMHCESFTKKAVQVFATVETGPGLTNGQMVVDWKGRWGHQPNVEVVQEVDHDLYGQLIMKGLLCSCK